MYIGAETKLEDKFALEKSLALPLYSFWSTPIHRKPNLSSFKLVYIIIDMV